MSLTPNAKAGVATLTAPQASKVTPGKGTVIALPRPTTPQPNGAQRTPQTTTVQQSANYQPPQGMVLVRAESGLLLITQAQAQAQAQAQGIIPRVNTAARAPSMQAASQVCFGYSP
ncbi:hypothetical protein SKAU_G00074010 [Synaphobranchus kaupii]|uniref:Uncharacterized protein n=1 Tax=Synaphobranchus kaupii TaxID=118154 RepID=A0A9Q1G8A2_SYNKA|nr:hypothetical protein SKAU_G00074010 [Synaphobranchus kaupii]